jgi:hypothetical protein
LARREWGYTSFKDIDKEDDQKLMLLFYYERLRYKDPDKKDTDYDPSEPRGPGKIARAMEMMDKGEI